MNVAKWIFRIFTTLFTLLTLMAVGMYMFNFDEVAKVFVRLGYPPMLMLPLGTAKVLGLIAIWTRVSPTLKNLAYAGFTFELTLAAIGHLMVADGGVTGPLMSATLLAFSFFSQRKLPHRELSFMTQQKAEQVPAQ